MSGDRSALDGRPLGVPEVLVGADGAGVTREEIIEEHTAPVRRLVRNVRRLVSSTVLEATERAYPGWHGIGHRHPDAGYFVGSSPSGSW